MEHSSLQENLGTMMLKEVGERYMEHSPLRAHWKFWRVTKESYNSECPTTCYMLHVQELFQCAFNIAKKSWKDMIEIGVENYLF